ncbi:MAG: hypothetical protein A3G41_03735 [Elusimicrobia bacterium RIFCSPLOWO2_12_FULL_59_9]|nr:MAG: hypothetical protein A3G41_03735 [Elusimicrobia bacterium RIFCSPLOWO2_12_FULL_59_9]
MRGGAVLPPPFNPPRRAAFTPSSAEAAEGFAENSKTWSVKSSTLFLASEEGVRETSCVNLSNLGANKDIRPAKFVESARAVAEGTSPGSA